MRRGFLLDTQAAQTPPLRVAGDMMVAHRDFTANEGFVFAVCGFGFIMYPLAELSIPYAGCVHLTLVEEFILTLLSIVLLDLIVSSVRAFWF